MICDGMLKVIIQACLFLLRLIPKIIKLLWQGKLLPFAVMFYICYCYYDGTNNPRWTVICFILSMVYAVWSWLLYILRTSTRNPELLSIKSITDKLLHRKSSNKHFGKTVSKKGDVKGHIWLGRQGGKPVVRNLFCKEFGENAGMLCYGGSGSGKSTGYIEPTILLCAENGTNVEDGGIKRKVRLICMDVKDELRQWWEKGTSDDYIWFAPAKKETWVYDVFAVFRDADNEDGDVMKEAQSLANCLIPDANNKNSEYFVTNARNILKASLVWCYKRNMNFAESIKLICAKTVIDLVNAILKDPMDGLDECRMAVMNYTMIKETEASSIMQTMRDSIGIIAENKGLQRAFGKPVSGRTFDYKSIENEQRALFVHVNSVDLLRTWSIVPSILFNQIGDGLLKRNEHEVNDPVLFLLDECASYLKYIHQNLSLIFQLGRSLDLCAFAVFQDAQQIVDKTNEQVYNVLSTNASYKLVLSSSSVASNKQFTEMVGEEQERQKSSTFSNGNGLKKNQSVSYNSKERAIIKPDEWQYLPLEKNDIKTGVGVAVLFTPLTVIKLAKCPVFKTSTGYVDPVFRRYIEE